MSKRSASVLVLASVYGCMAIGFACGLAFADRIAWWTAIAVTAGQAIIWWAFFRLADREHRRFMRDMDAVAMRAAINHRAFLRHYTRLPGGEKEIRLQ